MVATIASQSSTPTAGPTLSVKRARRTVTAGVAAIAAAALTACTVHPGVNYAQWGPHTAAVELLSSMCPAAAPMTYPGHQPREYDAVDFMLPGSGYSASSVACGHAIANAAVAMARNGRWAVNYTVFQQHIWNIQRAGDLDAGDSRERNP